MQTHLREFFIPVYEKYFSKLKFRKAPSEQDKLADAIYHEREFIKWLTKEYSKDLTQNVFKKLCTHSNFTKYITSYEKIKDRKEERELRKVIVERLQGEKLKPVTKYEYDVDIVEAYFNISNLLESVQHIDGFTKKEEYLKRILFLIENYCKKNNFPLNTVMQLRYPIVINSSDNIFDAALGISIIAFDINKIEAFLSYQNTIWKGEGLFASFVEHGVYRYVKNNSPFDNDKRLEKIMQWVGKNRYFILPEFKGENANKNPTLEYGETKSKYEVPFYWSYAEVKLTELYNALLLNQKIEKNELFLESFNKYEDFPTNLTVWKAKKIQLIYLLYLIYNKKSQHNSLSLSNIAIKLFKDTNKGFDADILNITFHQLRSYEKERKKLSSGLQSIKDIFDGLNLN